MKLLFISNFLNHHQKPLADYLYSILKDDYHFVSMSPMPEQIKKFGYPNYEDVSYNILYFKSSIEKEKTLQLVEKADVMIMGGVYNEELINMRLSTKKLLLFYSERWHKRYRSYLPIPLRWITGYNYRRFTRYNKENCYMLCASAFVPNDCRLVFAFKDKLFKWGYFPKFSEFDIDTTLRKKEDHKTIELLWIARYLKWKHPMLAIKSIEQLKKEGYTIHLTMIGGIDNNDHFSRKIYNKCKSYIYSHGLINEISMIGNIPNCEVSEKIRNSDILLFTSDRNEGWGAVLNEAMSNGCAVIASNMIGSVPYLIKNNTDGVIFKNKSLKDLINKIRFLIDNPDKRFDISKNAYCKIRDVWSPQHAADSMILLLSGLLNGNKVEIKNGPCSKAEIIK